MEQRKVDVAVIGAGSAGLTAFRAVRTHTDHVVLIEQGAYGTTCARVGCMPSKLLIAAANAAHAARHSDVFGIHAAPVRVDGAAVMRRVQAERDRFVDAVVADTEAIEPAHRLAGPARFLGPQLLQVGQHTLLEARAIVIATGSSAYIPAELQAAGDRLITSDSVFDWTSLPSSVAVVGLGVIGLELGQALHRLGIRVGLYGRGERISILDDPALASLSTTLFAAELDIRLGAQVLSVQRQANGVSLQSRDPHGAVRSEDYACILAATGRRPNLATLDLARAGLALDERGIPLHDPATMRCGDSSVFLAGDASNERPLLHEAVNQGRIAGDNAGAFPQPRPGTRHVPLGIAFCEPQLAQVGPPLAALQGHHTVTGRASFEHQGRSRVVAENQGALHIYAARDTGLLLGAQMVGPRAEHLAHLLAWALQAGLGIDQMLRMPYYHPVMEEAVRTALKDARDHMRKPPPPLAHCDDCTPGV